MTSNVQQEMMKGTTGKEDYVVIKTTEETRLGIKPLCQILGLNGKKEVLFLLGFRLRLVPVLSPFSKLEVEPYEKEWGIEFSKHNKSRFSLAVTTHLILNQTSKPSIELDKLLDSGFRYWLESRLARLVQPHTQVPTNEMLAMVVGNIREKLIKSYDLLAEHIWVEALEDAMIQDKLTAVEMLLEPGVFPDKGTTEENKSAQEKGIQTKASKTNHHLH
jgi:hypothetical protein